MRDGIHRVGAIPSEWRPVVKALEREADWATNGVAKMRSVLWSLFQFTRAQWRELFAAAGGQQRLPTVPEGPHSPFYQRVMDYVRYGGGEGEGESSMPGIVSRVADAVFQHLGDQLREIIVAVQVKFAPDVATLRARFEEVWRDANVVELCSARLSGERVALRTQGTDFDFDADCPPPEEMR